MKRMIQLVAALAVAVLFAQQAGAGLICQGQLGRGGECPNRCPSPAEEKHSSGPSPTDHHGDSCCQVLPQKESRAAAIESENIGHLTAIASDASHGFGFRAMSRELAAQALLPDIAIPSFQTLYCVFLI